jgi:hypothetical protein
MCARAKTISKNARKKPCNSIDSINYKKALERVLFLFSVIIRKAMYIYNLRVT